jgi:hypothetical protein
MRKQCRRKIWSTETNAIAHAIAGAAITTRDILDGLRLRELAALEAVIKGHGTVNDWQILCDLLNVAEMMGKQGVGPEVLPICEEVHRALHEAALRYERTRKIGLDGKGIQAIRELMEYADLQQSSVSRSEFERYIQKTHNYLRSGGKDVVEIS